MKTKIVEESREEIEKVLCEENLGYLGLSSNDKPYVVPLNYIYLDGRLILHCALTGKKLDYLEKNHSVCFSVARQSGTIEQHEQNNACLIHSESVMCFDDARLIENLDDRHILLNMFNKHFKPDAEDLPLKRVKHCYVIEIDVALMTLRQEVNLKRNHWEYRFS
jgi:uncharacterized protein